MYALFADETRGADYCGGQTQPPTATIARMEVTASARDTCSEPIKTKMRLSVNATLIRAMQQSTWPLERSQPVFRRGKSVRLVTLWYSSAGNIIASNSALIDSIPTGGTGAYESQVSIPGFDKNADIDHVEAYAEPERLKPTSL